MTLTSCNPGLKSLGASSDLNTVPPTFENPQNDLGPSQDLPTQLVQPTQPVQPVKPKPSTSQPLAQAPVSKIIYYAQKMIETEGKKLGTACNFYVHRVLQVAGFHYEVYLANDFDLYAKKYFAHYKAKDFLFEKAGTDVARLKAHIWSYPERTPFITQWSRSGTHGHIAIIERIADKLVIYQSSLGTKLPRKDQTTAEILLTGYNRRELTVYSEMTAKP
jgi:hypothetical protein